MSEYSIPDNFAKIEQLKQYAIAGRDLRSVVICQIALEGMPSEELLAALEDEDRYNICERFAFAGTEYGARHGQWNAPKARAVCIEAMEKWPERHRIATQTATRGVQIKFGQLTIETMPAALRWQEDRIQELMRI